MLGWAPVVPCECDFCGQPAAKDVSCREGESGGSGGDGRGSGGQLTSDVHQRVLHLVSDLCLVTLAFIF